MRVLKVRGKHINNFMKTLFKILIFIILLNLLSCYKKVEKFDKAKWNRRNDIDYNHREPMIDDLKRNYLKKGANYNSIVSLLGKDGMPSQYDKTEYDTIQLQYEIFVDYGWDIDPVETKTFVLNFAKDSTFINYEIYHYKK